MRNLGAVEAANEIRNDVFNSPGLNPEHQHTIRFVQSVCSQLGLDHTPENMDKVATVLHKHDIGLHVGHEYPKFAVRGHDSAQKVVHSAEEEQAWHDEAPVEPKPTPGPIISEIPPHQQNLDLTKQVPGPPETADHPEGRAPSVTTNREAAQDAHARQDAGHADVDDADTYVEEVDTDALDDNAEQSKGGATFAAPASEGVMANDDPDRDGEEGQDVDPTHDSVLGTAHPKDKSGDSSAGKTDKARRPVGTRRPM